MIVELGHFALILAFAVSIFQMVVPLVGAHKGWPEWMAAAAPAPAVALKKPRRDTIRMVGRRQVGT